MKERKEKYIISGAIFLLFLGGIIFIKSIDPSRILAVVTLFLVYITFYYAIQTHEQLNEQKNIREIEKKVGEIAEKTLELEGSVWIFVFKMLTNMNLREEKRTVEITPFIMLTNTGRAAGTHINLKYKYILADREITGARIKETPFICPQQTMQYKCLMQEFPLTDEETRRLMGMVGIRSDPTQNLKILRPIPERKLNMLIEISYQDYFGETKSISVLADFKWDDGDWGLSTP